LFLPAFLNEMLMGVGKWELNGELQASLGTASGEGSMVSGQRMVNLQWELGNGNYLLLDRGPRASSESTMVINNCP
jgi:hypothetical protein